MSWFSLRYKAIAGGQSTEEAVAWDPLRFVVRRILLGPTVWVTESILPPHPPSRSVFNDVVSYRRTKQRLST